MDGGRMRGVGGQMISSLFVLSFATGVEEAKLALKRIPSVLESRVDRSRDRRVEGYGK